MITLQLEKVSPVVFKTLEWNQTARAQRRYPDT
jgi:hypothetical protein